MAFPSSPTDGQIHSVGDRAFQWNATLGAWKRYANNGTINWQQYVFSRLTVDCSFTGIQTVATGLSGAITLSNSANKALVQIKLCSISCNGGHLIIDLYRNGSKISQLHDHGVDSNEYDVSLTYLDAPGSVGPHTYSVYVTSTNSGAVVGINCSESPATLLIAELKA